MATKKSTGNNNGFWQRHHRLKYILFGLLFIVLIVMAWQIFTGVQAARFQAQLQPFYDTSGLSTQGPLGEVVRQEPLGTPIAGGTGQRILYRTQRADGSNTFASGMVFVPSAPTNSPRPVVAWAHGTIGMGDDCAPTRLSDPIAKLNWFSTMLERGWVVTATDYAGLGTPGTEQYLVGNSEAHDVLNSVRAARQVANAQASNQFAVWGHSQGGHSALFTAQNASSYAPELQLISTVASAPAAELVPLLNQQYNTSVAWVIGPEVLVSWPNAYPSLNINSVTTPIGLRNYEQIAQQCISSAAIEGLVRNGLDQQMFSQNPVSDPAWRAVAVAQTAPILKPNQPLMVVESLSDGVVLPNTTALYIQSACANNSNLTSLWINNVGHLQIPQVTAPDVINWLGDRFAGNPTSPTCSQPLPITPANSG